MKYILETTARFDREFRKLDRYTQKMLKSWIDKHLTDCDNPRAFGKGLTGDRTEQWRYRIGDYRLIVNIQDFRLVILALNIGHQREIYE